jgi:16S rRNA (guanine966-N2)-methyltransferase
VRIIAGSHRGQRIDAPKGLETRPTSDRARESAFNLIGPLDDATVLDVFAGSGAMGLEALSRGAASCVFIEQSREATRTINANLDKLQLRGTVIQQDALRALSAERRTYDLVLCDPPYDYRDHARLGPQLARVIAPNGLLVYETAAKIEPEIDGLTIRTSRTYGSARLTLFEP